MLPEQVKKILTDPEVAVQWDVSQIARRRLAKQEIIGTAGDIARNAAMRTGGAITGAAAGAAAAVGLGHEGVTALTELGGGALTGLLLGQMSIKGAQKLIHVPGFQRWATNIIPS